MLKPMYRKPYEDKHDEEFKLCTYNGVKPDMYEVSNYGEIYSIPSKKTKSQAIDKDGYKRVNLCCTNRSIERNRKGGNFSVHKLVAHEFVINKDPDNNVIVNHMDGDKGNPYYGNLEHCTDADNRRHAVICGLMASGERNSNNIFPEQLVHDICFKFQIGLSKSEVLESHRHTRLSDRSLYDLIRHLYNRTSWDYITKLYNY